MFKWTHLLLLAGLIAAETTTYTSPTSPSPTTTVRNSVTSTSSPITTVQTSVTSTSSSTTTAQTSVTSTLSPITTVRNSVTSTLSPITTVRNSVTSTSSSTTTAQTSVTSTLSPITTVRNTVTSTSSPTTTAQTSVTSTTTSSTSTREPSTTTSYEPTAGTMETDFGGEVPYVSDTGNGQGYNEEGVIGDGSEHVGWEANDEESIMPEVADIDDQSNMPEVADIDDPQGYISSTGIYAASMMEESTPGVSNGEYPYPRWQGEDTQGQANDQGMNSKASANKPDQSNENENTNEGENEEGENNGGVTQGGNDQGNQGGNNQGHEGGSNQGGGTGATKDRGNILDSMYAFVFGSGVVDKNPCPYPGSSGCSSMVHQAVQESTNLPSGYESYHWADDWTNPWSGQLIMYPGFGMREVLEGQENEE